MNIYDKILVSALFFSVIVWQAFHQASLFKQQKTISHFWKGVWYGCAIILITFPYLLATDYWCLLKIPIIGILERMAFFDPILNTADHQSLFYNGPKVQEIKSKGSWVDRLENKLTAGQLKILKIAYVVLFIVVIIFIK